MLTTLIVSAVIAIVLAIISFVQNGSFDLAVQTFLTIMNNVLEVLRSIIDKLF